ncbi:MAG: hypothetical protein C0475_02610 [Planctomyces sp.]|nr:hypothetical protein [Planctomyces sp.]MBA4119090.1 hypothetical protein [Isosphaera sp.]
MPRTLTPEIMDRPDVDRAQLGGALRFIQAVNRWAGGVRALLGRLDAWSGAWPASAKGAPARRPITLLDVATGAADLPIAARRWALARGYDLRVLGVDIHPTTLELAQQRLAPEPESVRAGVRLLSCDALAISQTFGPASFDYAHAGLFLHHLADIDAMNTLRQMDRVARHGVVWNDLLRSPLAMAGAWATTLGAPHIVRHDARASVRAGFTRAEAVHMAQRAGLHQPRFGWTPLGYRFWLYSTKPGPVNPVTPTPPTTALGDPFALVPLPASDQDRPAANAASAPDVPGNAHK